MAFNFNENPPGFINFNGNPVNILKLNDDVVWTAAPIVLLDTNDAKTYYWQRDLVANNGWGEATPRQTDFADIVNAINCYGYNYCTVRINGNITSTPSGNTQNTTSIRVGFTEDYAEAVTVASKYAGSSQNGTGGEAYNKWYDLTLDISAFNGEQPLNVFIGGAYQNAGILYCSKITLHH